MHAGHTRPITRKRYKRYNKAIAAMKIIAGEYKGRSLLPPKGRHITRPITGLARKSLFSILGEDLSGALVLDLYCGTGTLGLEALSRGAAMCCFAERDRSALERLARNIDIFGAREISLIWRGNILTNLPRRLERLGKAPDVVFVDPPYESSRQWTWADISQRLFAPLRDVLSPSGTIVLRVDVSAKVPDDLAGLRTHRVKKYGNMVLIMLRRKTLET